MTTTQSLVGVLDALFSACTDIFTGSTAPDGTPVLVSYGDPGQYQPSAIVAVMDCSPSNQVDRPTLGTNRSRELAVDVSVMVSVYVPGGNEAHKTAVDSAAALVRLLEEWFRVNPNQALSGAARDSWVSQLSGPVGTIVYDPQTPTVPTGRVAEISATVTAKVRY